MNDLEVENAALTARVRELELRVEASELDAYQAAAMKTARFGKMSHGAVPYMMRCFIAVGEMAEVTKKVFRDKKGEFGTWEQNKVTESLRSIEFWARSVNDQTRCGKLTSERDTAIYPVFGLVGETGEVIAKLFKLAQEPPEKLTPEDRRGITAELGDVMYYVAAIASCLGVPLSRITEQNLLKIRDRLARNVIHGEGDDR